MDITFRCKSCAASLRVRADKAGHKVRCKRCGVVITIPTPGPPATEFEARSPDEDRSADAEPSPQSTADPSETEGPSEPVRARRKRPRRPKNLQCSADVRSAPGWRKVRLGMILIALFMCLTGL